MEGNKSAFANFGAVANNEEDDNSESGDDSEDEESVVANGQAVNSINLRNEEGRKKLIKLSKLNVPNFSENYSEDVIERILFYICKIVGIAILKRINK